MRVSGGSSPAVRAVVVTAATSLLMVLVAWATLIGPDEVFTGPGVPDRTFIPTERTCVPLPTTGADGIVEEPDNPDDLPYCDEAAAPDSGTAEPASQAPPPLWLKVLVWIFVFVGAALFLTLVVVLVRMAWTQAGPRKRRDAREEVAFTALGEPARLAREIAADAGEQDAVLREGDPRNAIVAAWQRFEVQGDAAGVGRQQWETSSEYALRILDLVAADAGATHRLAALYREARFSDHPITEDHRTQALDALATIRRSLAVRA
ncbi:protein of unknown function [Nocardioides alpinus]|uniref:DUF4129 domain-containing protein n=1 Tax=Nocardioides alpinus TaxID=748909 RepID=A0A1I0YBW2_9ACTN|nr:DUF4129 domain-containing protein [Nocardioides alpinus]PKH38922.1 DUF4129 domain-containing protein [Nocardioides alpinus]SFB10672.1 protein of unknown function [Nocardioides alpinus]